MPLKPPITKLETKPRAKSIGLVKTDTCRPTEGPQPVECLNGGGNGNDHRCQHKGGPQDGIHTADKHMVPPQTIQDRKARAIMEKAMAL